MFRAPFPGRGVHAEFRFDPGATTITTPVRRVLAERRGVCQDFAHLQISCLRSLGLAARYLSGYLLTDPPPGRPRLAGADASHAWISVPCPRHGWVDLDPTNDVLPDLRHVTLAWGRDYGDVSPSAASSSAGPEHTLHVGVNVTPLDPRSGTMRRSARMTRRMSEAVEECPGSSGARRARAASRGPFPAPDAHSGEVMATRALKPSIELSPPAAALAGARPTGRSAWTPSR